MFFLVSCHFRPLLIVSACCVFIECSLLLTAVSCDQRKQSTLEKMLESLQKDELVLEQLMDLSITINHPHQVCRASVHPSFYELQINDHRLSDEIESYFSDGMYGQSTSLIYVELRAVLPAQLCGQQLHCIWSSVCLVGPANCFLLSLSFLASSCQFQLGSFAINAKNPMGGGGGGGQVVQIGIFSTIGVFSLFI